MYLSCVEILNRFRSKLDFLRIFKVAQNWAKDPVLWPNFIKNYFSIIIMFSDAYTCP